MSDRKSRFPLDTISAGVILIIIAVTFLLYSPTISFHDIIEYFRSLGIHKTFIKPPQGLLDAAIFLFNAVGVWSLAVAGLRMIFQGSVSRALGDVTGAFFSFFIAYLINTYIVTTLAPETALGYFFVGIGVLIIVNAIINFAFRKKRFL